MISSRSTLALGQIAALAFTAGAGLGCGGNPGVPAFRSTMPARLAKIGAIAADEPVRLELKALPWWTVVGTSRNFILAFDTGNGPPTDGRRVGSMRSGDEVLSAAEFSAVRCAWKFVPMGDPRPCEGVRRSDAMEIARTFVERTRANLRDQARDAGVGVVGEVRCFAEQSRQQDGGRLWCEGVAIQTSSPPQSPVDLAETDPNPPLGHAQRLTDTKLVLHADASAGMLGSSAIVGATIGIRYRPIELGFYILDLQRESIAPMDGGLVGVGITGLGRFGIGRSRVDLIAGLSAVAVARNGATNPDFDGLFHGFGGIAYQTSWRISGAAQPFVQLRAGVAHGTHLTETAVPMFELHVGLSTPERR